MAILLYCHFCLSYNDCIYYQWRFFFYCVWIKMIFLYWRFFCIEMFDTILFKYQIYLNFELHYDWLKLNEKMVKDLLLFDDIYFYFQFYLKKKPPYECIALCSAIHYLLYKRFFCRSILENEAIIICYCIVEHLSVVLFFVQSMPSTI